MEKDISFWLVPKKEEKDYFQKIIDRLALKYDGPSFEPHVTIYAGRSNIENVISVAEEIAKNANEICMKITGISYSDVISKTLFVTFEDSKELTILSDELKEKSKNPSDYKLAPHLSLLYKKLKESTKKELAREINLSYETVKLDEFVVVSADTGVETKEDVEAWKTIFRMNI